MEKRCMQAGVIMILLAVFLRLMSLGLVTSFVERPAVVSALLLLETGRWVSRADKTPLPAPASPTETTAPSEPEKKEKTLRLSGEDSALVAVNNVCHYQVDVAALLERPLQWDLTGDEPKVLILHSHGSESYQNTKNDNYRSTDNSENMVCVGARLKEKLEAAGIKVIHDTTLHDQPSYNASYVEARASIEDYLAAYPSVCLVLDLHRDSVEQSGEQLRYSLKIDGQDTAKLMMVVGTDAGGRHHPNWQENMALAVKLHAVLEKQNPGICRAISFRTQRFNQDLSAGGMLIEVGAAGNSRQEALLAADRLADGIIALSHGVEGTLY